MRWIYLFILCYLTSPSVAEIANPNREGVQALFDTDGRPRPDGDVSSPNIDWEILKNADGANNQYMSVGAMLADSKKGSCSLTIIEPPGHCAIDPARPVMAITNGHCVGLLDNRTNVVRNQPYKQAVSFNHFIA